ncbi:helix-turn-helix transcriptional regulator [Bradyrhizobium sp. 186]|uniref:helix-turn-helix domain-containing protein n=1 Tax=Bradyrhizobium sp. 186 TaxID=2782654 RepID=UPI002000F685|nr:helix-turn-helix transcriptional regulator [Bradyrhizobium sp. 186]
MMIRASDPPIKDFRSEAKFWGFWLRITALSFLECHQHKMLIKPPEKDCQHKMLKPMSPSQCRAARALLDMTQPQLAASAKVGLSTVVDFERDRRAVSEEAVSKMQQALELAGIVLIPENGGGAGVRIRNQEGRS